MRAQETAQKCRCKCIVGARSKKREKIQSSVEVRHWMLAFLRNLSKRYKTRHSCSNIFTYIQHIATFRSLEAVCNIGTRKHAQAWTVPGDLDGKVALFRTDRALEMGSLLVVSLPRRHRGGCWAHSRDVRSSQAEQPCSSYGGFTQPIYSRPRHVLGLIAYDMNKFDSPRFLVWLII